MKNIKKYGYYTIGSQKSDVHTKLKDVIRLDLEERDKQLTQKRYTLDDLRDLESKLVLITSQESEESREVEFFMKVSELYMYVMYYYACLQFLDLEFHVFMFQTFNSVCRIGEVLLKLQQHGHDKYVCWMQRFGCRAEDLVGRLNEIAKELEDDLERWKEKIAHGRQKFYHLNYFTTQQLLSLRRELGSFKGGNPDRSVKPETLALLQSISRDITQRNVIKDLQKLWQTLLHRTVIHPLHKMVPHIQQHWMIKVWEILLNNTFMKRMSSILLEYLRK